MISSRDVEKSVDKFQYSFAMRTLSELGIVGNHLNLVKFKIRPNGEKVGAFLFFFFFFNYYFF